LSSKDVNRALREVVWPRLKERGFERRTARTAWRDRDEQVDVVNFQSFNAYNAGVLGITSYSFQVNLGIHPRCRTTEAIRRKDGRLRPEEYECDFRRTMRKGLRQPEHERETIWFVHPDGSNLRAVVEDARDVLLRDGMAWFEQLGGFEAMLTVAERAPESMADTWGMGNRGSPHQVELVGSLRAALTAERADGDEFPGLPPSYRP
jgi:hypothetical protein